MNLRLIVLFSLVSLTAKSAAPRSDLEIGKAQYEAGEFKQAVGHFHLALKANPLDTDSYYWIGLSEQALADIAVPFSARHYSNARVNLIIATRLSPQRRDCRRALFNLLLDSPMSSRSALQQAATLLREVSPNDLEYESMRQQWEQALKQNTAAEDRVEKLLLFVPQSLISIRRSPAVSPSLAIAGSTAPQNHRCVAGTELSIWR